MSKTTTELQTELEAIIAWFESDDVNIDQATDQYKRGLEIAAQIEERLQETKNTVEKLKQSFGDL